MDEMRVKSEVDRWFQILIYSIIVIIFTSLAMAPKEAILGLTSAFLVTTFLLWILWGTYYEMREEYLFCKSGPFFEKIPYEKIKSASLCQNRFSSMALSSKRIEIRQYGKGYILGTTMISPLNREEFLQQLLSRCNNLDKNNGKS